MHVICPHCAEGRHYRNYRLVKPDSTTVEVADKWKSFGSAFAGLFSGDPKVKNADDRFRILEGDYRRMCPNPGCNALLSLELFKRPSKLIAIVGESGSAKTSFLAANIHRWRNTRHMVDAGITYNPAGQSDNITDALERMFDQHEPPGTTFNKQDDVHREPFIVVARTHNKKEVNLVFIDVSGEDLAKVKLMASTARFLSQASHMFVMLTPMIALEDKRSAIAKAILEHNPNLVVDRSNLDKSKGNTQSAMSTLEVINGLIEMRAGDGKPIAGTDMGVSVILTKSDMLSGLHEHPTFAQYAAGIVPPKNWATIETDTGDVIDSAAVDRMSRRTRALVDQLNGNLVGVIDQNFVDATYHAVSASGCAAKSDEHGTQRFDFVKPYRCVDPFLHMLREIPQLGLVRYSVPSEK